MLGAWNHIHTNTKIGKVDNFDLRSFWKPTQCCKKKRTNKPAKVLGAKRQCWTPWQPTPPLFLRPSLRWESKKKPKNRWAANRWASPRRGWSKGTSSPTSWKPPVSPSMFPFTGIWRQSGEYGQGSAKRIYALKNIKMKNGLKSISQTFEKEELFNAQRRREKRKAPNKGLSALSASACFSFVCALENWTLLNTWN